MAGSPVIDEVAFSRLLADRRRRHRQVPLLEAGEALPHRRLLDRRDFKLPDRDPALVRLPHDVVAAQEGIAELLGEDAGQPLAAAKGNAADKDDRHSPSPNLCAGCAPPPCPSRDRRRTFPGASSQCPPRLNRVPASQPAATAMRTVSAPAAPGRRAASRESGFTIAVL